MVDRIREAQQNEDGFTLIELLIVIVVLGVLAGIVTLGLGTFRADAAKAACRADVQQVQLASDAFLARPSNATGAAAANVAELVSEKLLKAAPATGSFAIASDGGVTRTPAC